MKNHLNLHIFISIFVVVSIAIILLPSLAEANDESFKIFSLDIQNEPMEDVCKKIADFSGYDILIAGGESWNVLPVSVAIENGSVLQALKKMLKSQNKAIIVDNAKKRITLWLVDQSSIKEQMQLSERSQEFIDLFPLNIPSKSFKEIRDELGAENIEILPPNKPGEKGVTLDKIEAMVKDINHMDPNEIEVLPPGQSGEKGITLSDIQSRDSLQSLERMDPSRIEVLPPDCPGGKGVTLQESQRVEEALKKKVDQSDIQILLPPGEF